MIYLFTDQGGKKLELRTCVGMGREAQDYRRELEHRLGKTVIAWAHMGGDNVPPTF